MADRVPLVLLHGFPMDARVWDAQVAGLADVVEVTAVDLFGPRVGPFTIDELADDVHNLIGGRPCVLGGLSMGGYVALSVADRYPEDLCGLILFDTKATADDDTTRAARNGMIAQCNGANHRSDGAAVIAAEMGHKLLSPVATPEVRGRFRAMAASIPRYTLAYALAAMRDRPDRTAALARIAVPTLCVGGKDDAATPPAVVDDMRRQIPPARPLVVIPGAGHIPPMETPGSVNDAVRAFLLSL